MVLDGFEWVEPVARNRNTAVWRGVHVATGLPVALKRLSAEDDPRREVALVSRLRHPGIVRVYGMGTLPDAFDDCPKGTPWFAMSWLPQDFGGWQPADWPALRARLCELLEALAVAHGVGLVHCDIKPENLLQDPFGALRLADFGIAQQAHERRPPTGTPRYVAPEQIRGERLGPWTDVYAVCGVVWAWATGHPVFDHGDVRALLQAHLQAEPGPFSPRIGVPEGLEAWLRCGLSKAPSSRWQLAADALAALPEADAPCVRAEATSLVPPPSNASATLSLDLDWVDLPDFVEPTAAASPAPAPPVRPAPRPQSPAMDRVLEDPSLLPLRTPPLVGRETVCQTLWEALQRVVGTQQGASVALGGVAGSGASWALDWLVETAHQTGVARTWRVDRLTGDRLGALAIQLSASPSGSSAPDWEAALAGTPVAGEALPGLLRALVEAATEDRALIVRLPRAQRTLAPVLLGFPVLVVAPDWVPQGAVPVDVGPLAALDAQEFVRQVVPLPQHTRRALAEGAGGLPGVLMQQLVQLARAGRLVRDGDQVSLSGPLPVAAEDGMDAWPDGALERDLARIALCGLSSTAAELAQVSPELLAAADPLVGLQLLVPTPEGWSFPSPQRWRSVCDRLSGTELAATAAEQVLARRPDLDAFGVYARAGCDTAALDIVRREVLTANGVGALAYADRIARVAKRAGQLADPVVWERIQFARFVGLRDTGRTEEAGQVLAKLATMDLSSVGTLLERRYAANMAGQSGALDASIAIGREALALPEAMAHPGVAAQIRVDLAEHLYVAGDHQAARVEAMALWEWATANDQRSTHLRRVVGCAAATVMCNVTADTPDYLTWCGLQADLADRTGMLRMHAVAENNRAYALESSGALAEALDCYRRCVALLDRCGMNSFAPRLNISLALLRRQTPAMALPYLQRIREEARRSGHARWEGAALLLLAEAECGLGAMDRSQSCFELAAKRLRETGFCVRDLADSAARGADLAAAQEARDLSVAFRALADELYTTLGISGAP